MVSGKIPKVGITKKASEALARMSVNDAREFRRRHPKRLGSITLALLIIATLAGWGLWELVAWLAE